MKELVFCTDWYHSDTAAISSAFDICWPRFCRFSCALEDLKWLYSIRKYLRQKYMVSTWVNNRMKCFLLLVTCWFDHTLVLSPMANVINSIQNVSNPTFERNWLTNTKWKKEVLVYFRLMYMVNIAWHDNKYESDPPHFLSGLS